MRTPTSLDMVDAVQAAGLERRKVISASRRLDRAMTLLCVAALRDCIYALCAAPRFLLSNKGQNRTNKIAHKIDLKSQVYPEEKSFQVKCSGCI